MIKPFIPILKATFEDAAAIFPTGLILSVAAGCVEHKKYWSAYIKEFIGTLLMIVCTFSAGKWFGQDEITIAWTGHAIGVVAADKLGTSQKMDQPSGHGKNRRSIKSNENCTTR
jgi:hypothetical protein